MNRSVFSAVLTAAVLGLAMPAQAGDTQDFGGCDGLRKPKRSDDGMRGEATFPAYRFQDGGAGQTLAACDRALASGKLLPQQTLRRAHVMRARAVAKLQLKDLAGALADIDAAEQAGAEYAGDPFYQRSMGVSLRLLRAMVLSDMGDRIGAMRLAEAVAAERTFALAVQRVAALVRAANADDTGAPAIWQQLVRIDPAARGMSARLTGAPLDLAQRAAGAGSPAVTLSGSLPFQQVLSGDIKQAFTEWSAPVADAMITAYALAASGEPAAARGWIEAVRSALAAVDATGGAADEQESETALAKLMVQWAQDTQLNPMASLVEARIAITENRLSDAAAVPHGQQLRSSPVSQEFYAAYANASAGDPDAPALPPLEAAGARPAVKLASLAEELLIRPESQRAVSDYQRSRPNVVSAVLGAALSFGTSLLDGIPQTAGFRSTPKPDGSITVEYTGDTTSGAVVQEMTLLRAAELAREAGRSHFRIEARNDYQRYLVSSMYGVPQEQTLTGYKTDLTIRLVEAGAAEGETLDAAAIIEGLGPIYYRAS